MRVALKTLVNPDVWQALSRRYLDRDRGHRTKAGQPDNDVMVEHLIRRTGPYANHGTEKAFVRDPRAALERVYFPTGKGNMEKRLNTYLDKFEDIAEKLVRPLPAKVQCVIIKAAMPDPLKEIVRLRQVDGRTPVGDTDVGATQWRIDSYHNPVFLQDMLLECAEHFDKHPSELVKYTDMAAGGTGARANTVRFDKATDAAGAPRKTPPRRRSPSPRPRTPPLTRATPATAPKQAATASETCRNFAMRGTCMFGDKCRYVHEEKEKTDYCYDFQKGLCTRGSTCKYKHELQPATSRAGGTNKRTCFFCGDNGCAFIDCPKITKPQRDELAVVIGYQNTARWWGQPRNQDAWETYKTKHASKFQFRLALPTAGTDRGNQDGNDKKSTAHDLRFVNQFEFFGTPRDAVVDLGGDCTIYLPGGGLRRVRQGH
jgi:hypothetical protein